MLLLPDIKAVIEAATALARRKGLATHLDCA